MTLDRRSFLLSGCSALAFSASSTAAVAQTLGVQMMTGGENATLLGEITTVYTAAKIITMDPDQPAATAVAVKGKVITALGNLADVVKTIGNSPLVIDRTFENKVILPGFIGQHDHPLLAAASMCVDAVVAIEDWDLPDRNWPRAASAEEFITRLQSVLAESPTSKDSFIAWGYHHYFHGKLDRKMLDQISPERPLIVWHRSCHEFFLNTAALAKYGVTAQSVEGKGLASQQSNWEKGHFFEKGMELVIPPLIKDIFTPARLTKGLDAMRRYLLAKGITTICEPGTQMVRPLHQLYETILDADNVTFRTFFFPDGRVLFDKHKKAGTLDKMVADAKSYMKWGKGKVQWLPGHIKQYADGAIFSQAMQMQAPYLDGHKGEWIAEPDDYTAAFKRFWNAGYQIHSHVNGDAGLEVVTAALEERMKTRPRKDHRFTVVHFAVSTEDQVKRLAKAGAVISANPYYVSALADRYAEIGLGPERAGNMVRLGSAVREKMSISLHSDMPMAPADPLFLVASAASRITVSGRTVAPEQRITVERALSGVTIEAAYSLRLEKEIGSIKPGKRADFTILEEDPTSVSVEKVKDVKVWGVVFAGLPHAVPRRVASLAPKTQRAEIAASGMAQPAVPVKRLVSLLEFSRAGHDYCNHSDHFLRAMAAHI